MLYRIRAIVKNIEEKERIVEVKKDGEKRTESLGWWVTIKDQNVSFCLGDEKPDIEAGDELLITIEKRGRGS